MSAVGDEEFTTVQRKRKTKKRASDPLPKSAKAAKPSPPSPKPRRTSPVVQEKTKIATDGPVEVRMDTAAPLAANRFSPSSPSKKGNQPNGSDTPVSASKPPAVTFECPSWPKLSSKLRSINIIPTRASTLRNGQIRINFNSHSDYRRATKLFEVGEVPYFTYLLTEEKDIKVIIRNVTRTVTEEEAKDRLVELGYPVTKLKRIGRASGPFDMIAVNLTRGDEGKKYSLLLASSTTSSRSRERKNLEGLCSVTAASAWHHLLSLPLEVCHMRWCPSH